MKTYKQEAVQGDVVITPIHELPKNLRRIDGRSGRFILAEGEATGHAHTISAEDAELWEDPRNRELYLSVTHTTKVEHQEHRPVVIEPNIYRIGRVREYDYFLEAARKVID